MTLIVQARLLTHQHPCIILFCFDGFDPSWLTELSSLPTTQMLCHKGVWSSLAYWSVFIHHHPNVGLGVRLLAWVNHSSLSVRALNWEERPDYSPPSSLPWQFHFPVHPPPTKPWRYCTEEDSPQVGYGFFGRANSMVIPGGMLLIEPILPAKRLNIVFYPFDRHSGGHTFLLVRMKGGGWMNSLWRPRFSGRIRALWRRRAEGYGR